MRDYDAATLNEIGLEAMKRGLCDKAAYIFTKAIEKDPNNGSYYANRCSAYTGMIDMPNAILDGKKGVELCPNDATVYMRMGIIYDFLAMWNEALSYHEKALELEPDCEQYWAFVQHDKTRLINRGEKPATGVEFLEFLETKGEEISLYTRRPELYHFIDDITEDINNCQKYAGNILLDLFSEHVASIILLGISNLNK